MMNNIIIIDTDLLTFEHRIKIEDMMYVEVEK